MMTWPRSFRVRFLLVVGLVAIVPLGLVGVWLTRAAARSAEELLRARLHEAIGHVALTLVERWTAYRAGLSDLADSPAVRRALLELAGDPATGPPAAVVEAAGRAGRPFPSILVRDAGGRDVWTLETDPASAGRFPEPGLPLSAAVHASPLGPAIGSLTSTMPVASLLADRRPMPGSVGAIVGVFDARSGAPLVPLPFELPVAREHTFTWGGERWMAVRRTLTEPGLILVGAAPITPFEQPLRDAARAGLWILILVALAGLVLAAALTARMTGSLGRLAGAAEAVAGGDLERRVDERGADEVGRAARAFNRMTGSLRETLQALANQRALARAGEFTASLAHEVRNPLTAIRVDLQVVEENLPEGSRSLRPLRRALAEIERLDRTVGSALLATRVARNDRAPIDVLGPLEAAIEAARKSASRTLAIPVRTTEPGPMLVAGDASALEQLFLNLLLNAVEAVRDRGDVQVAVERPEGRVIVRVIDTGIGLTPEVARQAFELFFTTREGGTGLGLSIAARLARAHDGSVALDGAPGRGATVTVTLPLWAESV